jgi:DNA-binding CsgD family transcriptional regulator
MRPSEDSLRWTDRGSDRPCDRIQRLAQLCARSGIKRQIVQHLLDGRQRKQIAALLDRSTHTIDGHLKELYRALGVSDRAQLILLASRLQSFDAAPPPASGGRVTAYCAAT